MTLLYPCALVPCCLQECTQSSHCAGNTASGKLTCDTTNPASTTYQQGVKCVNDKTGTCADTGCTSASAPFCFVDATTPSRTQCAVSGKAKANMRLGGGSSPHELPCQFDTVMGVPVAKTNSSHRALIKILCQLATPEEECSVPAPTAAVLLHKLIGTLKVQQLEHLACRCPSLCCTGLSGRWKWLRLGLGLHVGGTAVHPQPQPGKCSCLLLGEFSLRARCILQFVKHKRTCPSEPQLKRCKLEGVRTVS